MTRIIRTVWYMEGTDSAVKIAGNSTELNDHDGLYVFVKMHSGRVGIFVCKDAG